MNILVPKLFGSAKTNSFFSFSASPYSVGEILHVAYDKKYKIKRKFTFFGKYQINFISFS